MPKTIEAIISPGDLNRGTTGSVCFVGSHPVEERLFPNSVEIIGMVRTEALREYWFTQVPIAAQEFGNVAAALQRALLEFSKEHDPELDAAWRAMAASHVSGDDVGVIDEPHYGFLD